MAVTAEASWENEKYMPHEDEIAQSDNGAIEQFTLAQEKPLPFDEDVVNFLENTTLHGFKYLAKPSEYNFRRVLWTVYITCCLAFGIYYGGNQIAFFLQFKKNSLVEVRYTSELPFPAITFCNENPFKLTPTVKSGWYTTARALTGNESSTIRYRQCHDDEFTCSEDEACVSLEAKCDGFPDCLYGSDEQNCERCRLIYLSDGDRNTSTAFNRKYVHQMLASFRGYTLYVSEDEPFVYMYNEKGVWHLANQDQQGSIYATFEADADLVHVLGKHTWQVIDPEGGKTAVEVEVACDMNFRELIEMPVEEIDGSLDMMVLYNNTAHRMEDLLTRCIWKGKQLCHEVGNMTTTMTDMGVCYTINIRNSVIDSAGWSYGMSLTFNIEHYEYVRRLKDGAGIKMYMHEPDEFPLMYGKGLSIAPGLVSYVDLKVTELIKLKPPWGSCTDSELTHYDKYGKTKCLLECEARLLTSKCGCRLFYMPQVNDNSPSCKVEKYFRCAVAELNKFRRSSKYCPECRDQCRRTMYSTATSFAQRGLDIYRTQDEREYNLQKKVFTARETTFRYLRQKYTKTLKIFHEMIDKMSQLLKYLDMLELQMTNDYEEIVQYIIWVYSDCYWSRDVLLDSQKILERQLLQPLDEYKQSLYKYLVKTFPSLDEWTSRLVEIIDNAHQQYKLDSEPLTFNFDGCKADCRNTLEGMDYIGRRSVTLSGLTCQRWDAQSPHRHPYKDAIDKRFPDRDIVDAANFCRNPDGKNTGPWCYTTDPGTEWETCQVPICSDCREIGEVYRGNRQLTLSGRTCQRWDSHSPHQHRYNDASSFPDDSLEEASNFCRNPNNSPTGPWCYTTDPNVESETCAIPLCHDCKMKNLGTDYTGTKSVTRSGIPCQRWDMQYPHEHSQTDANRFPDATVTDASNFCRNPNQNPTGPWCFTTDPDVKWETCDIPLCSGCRSNNDTRGTKYTGTQSFTIFGRACQRWDSQTPHKHSYTDASMFPDASLKQASNYCRNPDPDKHSAPWCYTRDPDIEWEPCDIALCNDCMMSSTGADYTGNKAMTITRLPCQRWDSQYPHSHTFTDPDDFPDSSVFEANNYCRNPDGDVQGPWCFTNDPEVRRETCGIGICQVCKIDEKGNTYSGTADRTKSGISCQKWSSQTPHPHPHFSVEQFPDATLEEASNYCRNPDGRYGMGPWCYTTDPDVELESCGLPMCSSDCVYTTTGGEYRGNKQTTLGGVQCQSWAMTYPHHHKFTDPGYFPDDSVAAANNFCRNPDKRLGTGPWCYTIDPDTEWQSCGIARCLECVKPGEVYTGERPITVSGLSCQRWDSQTPHKHKFTDPAAFPDVSLGAAENFCRNPDNRPNGPWCYTTNPDVEMETCAIAVCSGPDGTLDDFGSEYRGYRVTTRSGLLCQRWDMQSPHTHPFRDSSFFPDNSITEAANYCRNPGSVSDTGPWCYTQDTGVTWETCSIINLQERAECLLGERGLSYVGKQVTTASGRTCQSWSRQSPHQHSFTDDQFPDKSLAAASNYCRNPDNKVGGPWCFTQDPLVEWEHCDIYSCSDCRSTYLGDDYRGQKSKTASGFTCQRWDSQVPHAHNFTDGQYFPEGNVSDAANYCRNPDGRPGDGPWCFTTDTDIEWEFCGIPFCYKPASRMSSTGREYTGVQAVTVSGLVCQYWDSQLPHPHPYVNASLFPDAKLRSARNYCRNPDGKPTGPWCYTMDPSVEWETCSIPLITDCRHTKTGVEYLGRKSVTASGLPCQKWDSQDPHAHNFTDDSYFPDLSISDAANYCRNPDGKASGPWCFTTDPVKVWESCGLPLCDDCKDTQLGTRYKGERSYTASGRICQKWSDQVPHSHSFVDSNFSDHSLQGANNYCRNPDRHPDGPWCFTIDPQVRREPCAIKLCVKPGCRDTEIGNTYGGRHFRTKTGILCQRWDQQSPHQHPYTNTSMFPDSSMEELANYCRNPDQSSYGPWCYTMDPAITRQSCGIPMCSDCMYESPGASYTGNRVITASGRVCQRWDSQHPHAHNVTDANLFPDRTLADAENYCRNPDGTDTGPWCYTQDPDVERESCAVPMCSECRTTYYGYDYLGQVATTVSGIPCQRWDQKIPHDHQMKDTRHFPDWTVKDARNYCRNPGRRYGYGTWCYTEDPTVEWEPCGVPLCRDCTLTKTGIDYVGKKNMTITGAVCESWSSVPEVSSYGFTDVSEISNYCRNPGSKPIQGAGPWCESKGSITSCGIPLCKDCKETNHGWEYQGKRSVTSTGKTCLRWDDISRDNPRYGSNDLYPDNTTADAANYCRNPDRRPNGPWCFIDKANWETCGIPYCAGKDCTWQFKANEYRGTYSHTVSGRTCMRWGGYGGQNPHKHNFTDSSFMEESIDEAMNYCRNPNNTNNWPWCYTTDPLVEQEYCPVINCRDCRKPGRAYEGKRSFTKSGLPCQRWDQSAPHVHSYTDEDFPGNESVTEASNYCRTPDGADSPWCFTLDPEVRKEDCMIQDCFDCYSTRYGTDYVGTTNTTIGGRECQRWDSQTPHAHSELLFPDATISDANNYCRNPDQEKTQRSMPWCYTTDPDVEWEYCTVPMCDDALDGCTPAGDRSWNYVGKRNVTKYGFPCDFWSDHPAPVTEELFIVGNIKNGRLHPVKGVLTQPHGLITDGHCYRRTVSISEQCSDPVVYGDQGDCNGTLSIFVDLDLVDMATACGLSANATVVDSCCLNETKSCHLKNATDWCTKQLGDDCEVAVCCESGCNASASNSSCLSSTNMSFCCNASTFDCCTDFVCTKNQTTCYESANVTGYSFANRGREIYDADHRLVSDDLVNCYLNITADVGKMKESVQFGRRSPEVRNYCRNPDVNLTGPWCYATVGRTVIRQSCDVPLCTVKANSDCRQTYDGFDYQGKVSRTLSGNMCQRWDRQEPWSHPFNESSYFPDSLLSDANNYCRNPDRQPATGPWCFTLSSIQDETCGLPLCTVLSVPQTPKVIPVPPAPIYTPPETSGESTEEPSYTTPAAVSAKETGYADSNNSAVTNSNVTYSGGGRSSPKPITVRCDYHLYRSVSRYNQSLWKMTHRLIYSLRALQRTNIDPDGIPHYVINQTMLQLVEANIGHQCAWCVTSDGTTPFLDIVKERLDEWKSVALSGVTVDVLANVEETMARFFRSTSSWDAGQPILADDVKAVRTEFKEAASSVKEAMRVTQHTMALVKEATYLNGELLNNIWELECKVQLQKLLDEYHRYRQTFKKVIDEFRRFVTLRNDELRARIRRYTSESVTLESISRETNFIEMRLKLLGAKITIDRSLDKGQLLLTNIQSQINKIYYSIMSYVQREHIKSRSAYWRHLNVTDPGVKLPTLHEVRGIMMANVDYGMVPDSAGLEKWARKVSSLDAMRLAMERYIRILMDVALAEGRDYLKGYLKGNQINEEFYRKNFLQVELFYQEMASRKVIEEAVYTTGDLFSEVGGLSGLLLGASVQSFVELFDFLVYFIWKKCKKLKSQ